jgi:sigma-B regulation protein RsbU (phosphoserine phosphatase)
MNSNSRFSIWIIIIAAVLVEVITCVQYFTNRAAIRDEAVKRAECELSKAELEIRTHTIEMESAAEMLAMLAEKNIDQPDSVASATRLVVSTLGYTSIAVAFLPNYFPQKGEFYEVCSSHISEDSIFTRNIGSAEHDYTQMEWFQNGFVHDSCWWSEPYLDDSGSQAYVVSCSHPVRDRKGEIVGVVCIDLALDYLQRVSEYLQIYPESHYTIVSGTGIEIVPSPDTIPGRKYQIYDRDINDTGWKISIIIPEEVIFADLNRIGIIVGILMIIGLGLLLFIVIRSARNTQKLISVSQQKQKMEGELEIAQTIQRAMLPKVFPPFADRLDLNIYGIVDPAKEIGGDLYDFYVRHDKLFFCVGDVSGKGVPASLVMATIRSLFRSVTSHEEKADRILSQINNAMSDQNDQNMFVTLFVGVLSLDSGELNYCNAGHNAPIVMHNGHWSEINVLPNLPIGVLSGFDYQAQEMQLSFNDLLFLYTDGLTEAENMQHEQFGEVRMMETLQPLMTLRPRHIVENMRAKVAAFAGNATQSDDLTMLAIRYQTPAILMRNDIQQIPTLAEWIEGLGIPEELNMPINLALEEAVSNVMLYAYPGRSDGKVFVEFQQIEQQLIFTISDSGIAFDPTQAPEADTTLSAEERAIGGLGIHLVRQLMDSVTYEHVEDKNILTLVKNL